MDNGVVVVIKNPMSKRCSFLLLGCFVGLAGFFVDIRLVGNSLATAQMMLWSAFVFGAMGIQAGGTLKRPRQAGVALSLTVLHCLFLARLAKWLPLPNAIGVIAGAVVETVVMLFLYARIGQTVDPNGPYGLTAAEIEREHRVQERLD